MHTIWDFLLQTTEASLLCLFLLLIKTIFFDQLSPRWQYGIWSLLALRLLMPAGIFGKYLFPQFAVFLEGTKASVECSLSSVYSAAYTPIGPSVPFPLLQKAPQSVTDWLFVLYLAGVCFFLLKYLVGYLRLRGLLRHGLAVSEQQQAQLLRVCADFSLRPCPMVAIPRLPSALICGVFRPVLAIPAEVAIDDQVLLHELLHKRHYDALQNMIWSILRAMHWCNPLLQYAFSRIQNDMESLCDQRVLERLDGEERRDYTTILLSMTSERYPRVPGTSSLSNGGRSIARRMQATLRFKKYPRGMAIISLCIVATLLGPAALGAEPVPLFDKLDTETLRPDGSPFFQQAMASARLRRATTMAGAVDTYAKALLYKNPVYLAAVTPFDAQARLMQGLERGEFPLKLLDDQPTNADAYYVYNMERLKDGSYQGLLVLHYDMGEQQPMCLITIPIHIAKETEHWIVSKRGHSQALYPTDGVVAAYAQPSLPILSSFVFTGKTGTLRIDEQTVSIVKNENPTTDMSWFAFGPQASISPKPQLDAAFSHVNLNTRLTYTFTGDTKEKDKLFAVGLESLPIDNPTEPPILGYSQQYKQENTTDNMGLGKFFRHYTLDADQYSDEEWSKGSLVVCGNFTTDWNYSLDFFPVGYAVQIYHNYKPVETVQILRGNAP